MPMPPPDLAALVAARTAACWCTPAQPCSECRAYQEGVEAAAMAAPGRPPAPPLGPTPDPPDQPRPAEPTMDLREPHLAPWWLRLLRRPE